MTNKHDDMPTEIGDNKNNKPLTNKKIYNDLLRWISERDEHGFIVSDFKFLFNSTDTIPKQEAVDFDDLQGQKYNQESIDLCDDCGKFSCRNKRIGFNEAYDEVIDYFKSPEPNDKDRVMHLMAQALEYLRDENIFKDTADMHINQALQEYERLKK